MNAIVIVGHGSLLSDSGKAMIRLGTLLEKRAVAPIVEAGFLNYSQPMLAEAVDKAVGRGATTITIQPYFLIEGKYVRDDLHGEIAGLAARHPQIRFAVAAVFGQHRLMADILFDRLRAVDPALGTEGRPTGLVLMAHGTPYPEANAPLERVGARIHARADYCRVIVGYLDCNEPTIDQAIDLLMADGTNRIIALPFFLHEGRHVQRDLPQILSGAQQRHPAVDLRRGEYIGYDPRMADIIADRVKEAKAVGELAIGD